MHVSSSFCDLTTTNACPWLIFAVCWKCDGLHRARKHTATASSTIGGGKHPVCIAFGGDAVPSRQSANTPCCQLDSTSRSDKGCVLATRTASTENNRRCIYISHKLQPGTAYNCLVGLAAAHWPMTSTDWPISDSLSKAGHPITGVVRVTKYFCAGASTWPSFEALD
jgi:hypothetical protein